MPHVFPIHENTEARQHGSVAWGPAELRQNGIGFFQKAIAESSGQLATFSAGGPKRTRNARRHFFVNEVPLSTAGSGIYGPIRYVGRQPERRTRLWTWVGH
jgi:hypothetical protein